MKKFIKSKISAFIFGAILFSSVTGVFAYNILAKDIEYTPSDETWSVNNVKSAIDELYGTSKTINIDELEKLQTGVSFEGDYFYIYTPNIKNIEWDDITSNMNYEKIIFCHKESGHNANFTATLPFSLDGKTLEVKQLKIIGNSSWNPVTKNSSGINLNVDVNYGTPETAEYYFYVGIK